MVCLLPNKVLDQPIVELLSYSRKLDRLSLWLQLLCRLVQLEVLADLFKEFKNILWRLVLDRSLENWPHDLVSHLDVLSIVREK